MTEKANDFVASGAVDDAEELMIVEILNAEGPSQNGQQVEAGTLSQHAGVLAPGTSNSLGTSMGSPFLFPGSVSRGSQKGSRISGRGRPRGSRTGRGGSRKVLFGKSFVQTEGSSQHAGVLAVAEATSGTTLPLEIQNTDDRLKGSNGPRSKILRKATSSVWDYFEIDEADPSKAKCTLCNISVFRGTGTKVTTTTMARHVRNVHCVSFGEKEDDRTPNKFVFSPKMKQSDLKTAFANAEMWGFNHPKAIALNKKIGEMLVIDNLPFSFVENPGFLAFMKCFFPKYKVPGRHYFSGTVIPGILKEVEEKISDLLSSAKHVSFTADLWTSANNHGYIGLTVHWIESDFTPKNFLLAMEHFPGCHTTDTIRDKLNYLLEKWKIPKAKVHVIVRDNALNISNAIRDAGLHGVACYIHTLQLVISDSITSQRTVVSLLAKCRGIVSHVHRAHNISDRFAVLQKQDRESDQPKGLVQDVPTRWNSSYYMLERFYDLKSAVLLLASEFEFVNVFVPNDWSLISRLLTILKPFEAFTRIFSSEHCFISEIIPSIHSLKSFLNDQVDENDSQSGLLTLKRQLLSSVNERFQNDIFEDNTDLTFATLLDPRFKTAFFSSVERQTEVKNNFIDELIQNFERCHPSTASQEPPVAPVLLSQSPSGSTQEQSDLRKRAETSLWATYAQTVNAFQQNQNNLVSSGPSSRALLTAELNMYLSAPNLPLFADEKLEKRNSPLLWWKINIEKYPNIGSMVFKYLSSPPSSVYSERCFSEAGNVYEVSRSSLKPETAGSLTFLKHNIRALNFEYSKTRVI